MQRLHHFVSCTTFGKMVLTVTFLNYIWNILEHAMHLVQFITTSNDWIHANGIVITYFCWGVILSIVVYGSV
eukprot:TRINITY_DN5611_c0_g1_i1.p2 TRINITY_DN5611_c0_g1~~TRINITY_DN5611_c0_g1_i1.p2  ORF type:complete len:72 (+),score=6.24 TRINITY_DN5611_c0_g1_i1:275-490(+)